MVPRVIRRRARGANLQGGKLRAIDMSNAVLTDAGLRDVRWHHPTVNASTAPVRITL